jgi:hypothetical protein
LFVQVLLHCTKCCSDALIRIAKRNRNCLEPDRFYRINKFGWFGWGVFGSEPMAARIARGSDPRNRGVR